MTTFNKTHDDIGEAVFHAERLPPQKKVKRLRIIWFALGLMFGIAAAYGIFSFLHRNDEIVRLNNRAVMAEVSYETTIIRSSPPTTLLKPAVMAPIEIAPGVEAKMALPTTLNLSITRGDTLTSMLTDIGISYDEAQKIMMSMKKVYNPKRLGIGQALQINVDKSKTDKNKLSVNTLTIPVSSVKTLMVLRTVNNTFVTRETKAAVHANLMRGGGVIRSSLYETAVDSGMPASMVGEIIGALSYDIDFQRDIQPGDKLDVLYERMHTDKGVPTGFGKVIYASLDLGDRTITIYRHTSHDGFSGFYNAKGESVKKALLRTPINGAHITSGFGFRMHPLLGYSKMHKGIDFGAVTGTPIYAAGDGVIAEAGRKGGYGNYVRIKHNNNYSTAYGHASRIARGIRPGAHVRQGQVIAYVGSTGMSTGPHLHYEILVGNTQVNPSGVKFRTGQTLGGHELAQFKQQVKQVQVALNSTPRKAQVALK